MKRQKTKAPPQVYSVNSLSKVTGKDRRTIDKLLMGVTPVMVGDQKKYLLADVESAIVAKPDKSLREEKLAEEIRKLRIKNDRDESKLISVEFVCARIANVLAKVDSIIEQKLSNEYPSAVAGLDVPQSRIYGKRLGDQIRVEFQSLAKEWE